MFRRTVVAVAMLVAAGTAAADLVILDLASAAAVTMTGRTTAEVNGGAAEIRGGLTGLASLEADGGAAEVWRWTERNAGYGGRDLVAVQEGDADSTRHDLTAGSIRLTFEDNETVRVVLIPGEGAKVSVRGATATTAAAAWLAAPVPGPTPTGLAEAWPFRLPPDLYWRWEAGWAYLGAYKTVGRSGWPALENATLEIDGPLRLLVEGGQATIRDASGREHEASLRVAETVGGRGRARLLVEATGLARFPLGDAWGVGGPRLGVAHDGDILWRDASGSVRRDDGAVEFDDSDVSATGVFSLRLAPASAAADVTRWQGDGDVQSITVGGASVVRADPTSSAPLTLASVLLLLLGAAPLGWKLLPAFYSRIRPNAVLEHPLRRRLYEVVTARPGILQSELQAVTEAAWGAFTFHLRMLQQAGYVRVEKQGRYVLVFPCAAPARGLAAIPQRTARRAYEALPEAGGVPFPELRAKLGLSRQLLMHHLRSLERRGYVRLTPTPDRSYVVARAEPGATTE